MVCFVYILVTGYSFCFQSINYKVCFFAQSWGKSTGVGCHALLQGVFPTQGLNPGLPHCSQILYHLSHIREALYSNNFDGFYRSSQWSLSSWIQNSTMFQVPNSGFILDNYSVQTHSSQTKPPAARGLKRTPPPPLPYPAICLWCSCHKHCLSVIICLPKCLSQAYFLWSNSDTTSSMTASEFPNQNVLSSSSELP